MHRSRDTRVNAGARGTSTAMVISRVRRHALHMHKSLFAPLYRPAAAANNAEIDEWYGGAFCPVRACDCSMRCGIYT